MRAFWLMSARLVLAAWVGAAVLFVIVSVREVTNPAIGSTTRDHLALIRFPAYYVCGFVLLTTGLTASLLAIGHPAVGRKRAVAVSILVAAALLILVADYYFVYGPLREMIRPVGAARPAEFQRYHRLSEGLNGIQLLLSLAAAALLSWSSAKR